MSDCRRDHSSEFGFASDRKPDPAPRLSIVVLPFVGPDDDPLVRNLADGLTEDLTTDLSLLPDLRVVPRSAAFTYRTQLFNARQIGGGLGPRYLLEGSIRRLGNQLRVNAHLIDAESGGQLWAEWFDREMGELSGLQNEITSRIANPVGDEHPEFFMGHAKLAAAYGLNGESERAVSELAVARKTLGGRDPSIGGRRTSLVAIPKLRALFEATCFAGLTKAGVPGE